jgi:hypothetical protein
MSQMAISIRYSNYFFNFCWPAFSQVRLHNSFVALVLTLGFIHGRQCKIIQNNEHFILRCTSRLVCRFLGRLLDKTIHALPRQASEKRQGTKSRAGRGSVSPLRSMGI